MFHFPIGLVFGELLPRCPVIHPFLVPPLGVKLFPSIISAPLLAVTLFLPVTTVSQVVIASLILWEDASLTIKNGRRLLPTQHVDNDQFLFCERCIVFFRGVLKILTLVVLLLATSTRTCMHRCAQTSTNVQPQGTLRICILIVQQRMSCFLCCAWL